MMTNNTHPTWAEVSELVGEHLAESWFKADSLTLYKRDDVGYGLIGLYNASGETYVASTMSEPENPFTVPMVKDLLKLSSNTPLTLITDVKEFHNKVKDGLKPHGFKFAIMGDVMYSRNNYNNRNKD